MPTSVPPQKRPSSGPPARAASTTCSRRSGGLTLAGAASVTDARFGLHNLGSDLPHTAFTGTGHWLRTDEPEKFDCILDTFPARAEATGVLRVGEPGK
jgi:hypothetical protein